MARKSSVSAPSPSASVFEEEKKRKRVKKLHTSLFNVEKEREKKISQYTRQVSFDDLSDEVWEETGLAMVLRPPFSPTRMYELYEESGALMACIEAYIQNVDGYGHLIVPRSGSEADLPSELVKEKIRVEQIFAYPNGDESFDALRLKCRRDFEVTGNGYIEVLRDLGGRASMLFWADAKRIRLVPYDGVWVQTTAILPRGDEEIRVPIYKQFRTFVMLTGVYDGRGFVRYFKEFGDPRIIDAVSGKEYDKLSEEEKKEFIPATELIHFKFGNGYYGVPRWVGTVLNVLGSSRAEYVNFDLFDGQGIPPLIISIAGGELTDESFDDLIALLTKSKGVKNFHKVLLLQVDPTTSNFEGKEALPKIDIKDMMEFRKEDALFGKYLNDAREAIRKYGFRMPAVFVGSSDGMNFATAKISRELAEEQIFIPERRRFDEIINMTIIRDLGIKNFVFKTRGPVIKSSEDVIAIFPQLLKSGVFTMNELVEFTNNNFGLNLTSYDEEWANLPISLLLHTMQSIGTYVGSGLREGGGLPNALGSMKPMIDEVKKLLDIWGPVMGEKPSLEENILNESRS